MTRTNLLHIINYFANFLPALKGKFTKFTCISLRNISICLLLAFVCASCQTYKRSFGNTYTSINALSTKIYRLDLSHQDLSKLPENIAQCEDLRMLNLSGNTKLDLNQVFATISAPEKLEVLILDSLQIEDIPQSINRFINLKHISLNENPQADFESVIDKLKELPLAFIDLQNNDLSRVPSNLYLLEHLKSLNLSNNKLGSSKDFLTISKLKHLTSLWLTRNHISTLPSEIVQLKSLRNLYLEHNLLEGLPDQIAQMPKLWVLHLSHNRFKELPSILTRINSLYLLHINNNAITHIPEVYTTEKYSLMGIILDNNQLSNKDIARWEKAFSKFFQASF